MVHMDGEKPNAAWLCAAGDRKNAARRARVKRQCFTRRFSVYVWYIRVL
jgi:hypothetical protein